MCNEFIFIEIIQKYCIKMLKTSNQHRAIMIRSLRPSLCIPHEITSFSLKKIILITQKQKMSLGIINLEDFLNLDRTIHYDRTTICFGSTTKIIFRLNFWSNEKE